MRLFLYLYTHNMNYILFDDDSWEHLLPLTYTRPVCALRVGLLTLKENWEHRLGASVSFITQDYLADKYPVVIQEDNVIINGSILANDYITKLVKELEPNEALLYQNDLIAARIGKNQFEKLFNEDEIDQLKGIELTDTPIIKINALPDLFQANNLAIHEQYRLITQTLPPGRDISADNQTLVPEQIYVHPTARVNFATLNAQKGPIYIGPYAEVMEGALLRGPIAVCHHSTVKMGAQIYGATTIGPHSKIGGEIKNVILHAYSNKGHSGYLGDSYIGKWCNLGADTNNSNLKNNYSPVRLWSYPDQSYINTSTLFCGLFMADHSKTGINTMFNSGTVVGVGANIFGAGYPPKFIPSFSWGAINEFHSHKISKMLDTAQRVVMRRDQKISPLDSDIIHHVYSITAKYRHWEKT